MQKTSSDLLKKLLKKRLDTLGYGSLKQFHADRKTLGLSYELLRQVIHAGRVPRSETLLRILEELQFSPSQSRKILETCYGMYAGRPPAPPSSNPADPGAPTGDTAAGEAARPSGPEGRGKEASDLLTEGPEEIAARLSRDLPRIPLERNEDFWDVARHLASLAGRKVQELARRQVDQPLLFEKEPEAIYQFLVRRGKIPPYMSRGENLVLGYETDIDYRDRFRGALLGASLGEMLGAPAQGLTPRDVRELYGRIEGMEVVRRRKPLALLVARSLLNSRGTIDPALLSAALGEGSDGTDGPSPGVGAGRTLDIPWFERGINAPDCLPAAGVAAVALLRAGDFRRLKLEAGILASVMRPNPSAICGTVVQAAAVAKALHGRRDVLDAIGFARLIAPVIEGLEPDRGVKARGGKAPTSLSRRLGTDLPALLLRRAEIDEIREVLGNGTAAHEGIPFAWACFLCSPDDFAAAVLAAANQGNASEETSSLAGALCGARLGASGIPRKLLDPLPFREEIEGAADGLLALARGA